MSDIKTQMKNISKVFKTEDMETHALKDINLTISSGDYASISGPSGCGKSTLLSLIGLLEMLSGGEYIVEGVDAANLSLDEAAELRSSKIGLFFNHLTGLMNCPYLTTLRCLCATKKKSPVRIATVILNSSRCLGISSGSLYYRMKP